MQSSSDQKVQELLKQIKDREEADRKAEQERLDSKKTEAQKNAERLEALEKERDDAKAEAHKQRLRNVGISKLTAANIPVELEGFSLMEYLAGPDEETTAANVEGMQKYLNAYFTNRQQPYLKENGRKPGTTVDAGDRYYTEAQLATMSPQERDANWSKVMESMKFLETH